MKLSLRIVFSIALLLSLITFGTLGFMEIEQWNLLDALYMAIITLTTVGFKEVHPLSPSGKLFTVVYIVLGIGSAGFAITTLFTYLFEGPMMRTFKERRMNFLKKHVHKHPIICGYGPIGREVVQEFNRAKIRHILISKQISQETEKLSDYTLLISGDAQDEEVLREAKINDAQSLVAVLEDDPANLFLVMTARQLNPSIKIIAEATTEGAIKKLKRAGADVVITPYQIVGKRIVESILKPTLTHFLDIVSEKDSATAVRIEEYTIPANSTLIGKNLRDSNIGQKTGAIILAIVDRNSVVRSNSQERTNLASIPLQDGDSLIAIGNEEQLGQLENFLRSHEKRLFLK